jgi:conjugal transfer/entry exclusion protein
MVERANLITLVQQLINQKDNTIQQTIAERMRGSQSMPEIVEQLQTVLDNAKKVKTDINKLEANENLLARRLDTLSDVTTKHVNNFGPIGTEQQAPGFGKNTSNS